MVMRPVDENGDVLPVLSYDDLLDGPEAVAQLVEDRLNLLTGDWWENSAWGCDVLEMIRDSRLTDADQEALASYLSTYIRQTSDVQQLEDVDYYAEGREFYYSCTVITAYGEAEVEYSSES